MIYVRIELWPKGKKEDAKLLQEIVIHNISGDEQTANYNAYLSHSTTYKGNGFSNPDKIDGTFKYQKETWKTSKVIGFKRLKECAAELVFYALAAMFPNKPCMIENKRYARGNQIFLK